MLVVLASVSSVGQRNCGSEFVVVVGLNRGNSCRGVSSLLFFKRALITLMTTITRIAAVVQAMIVDIGAVAVVVVVIVVVAMVVVFVATVHIFDIAAPTNI